MERAQIQVGDWIVLTQAYMNFPAGTHGIVVHLYRFDREFCRVRFDPAGPAYPIHRRHFALAERPARAGRGDSQIWAEADLS